MWGDSGLANDLWFLLVFSVLDVLTALMPVDFLLKIAKKKYALRSGLALYEQNEANKLFESAEFQYSVRVSKYSKLLMVVLFINSIFPFSSIVGIAYLGLFYWADKIFLLRVAKVPQYCTSLFGNEMLKFFDMVLISYAVRCSHHR